MRKTVSGLVMAGLMALLVAAPAGATTTITGGNAVTSRATLDTYANFVIVDTNHPISGPGMLTSWSFWAGATSGVQLVIVRVAGGVATVVGESATVTPSTTGAVVTTALSPSIPVLAGDFVGLYFASTGVVPFDGIASSGTSGSVLYTMNGYGDPTVGAALTFQGAVDRTYSVSVSGDATPAVGDWTLYPAQTDTTNTSSVDSTVYQAAVQQPINADGTSSWPAKRGVIPVQFSLSSATKTVTTTTETIGPVVFESILSDSDTSNDYSALSFAPSNGLTFNQIWNLQAGYTFTQGNCGGGSLRWSVDVNLAGGGHGSVFIYYGGYPNFTDCKSSPNNQSGANMIGLADLRYDTSQVGGSFYDTYAHALALVGADTVNFAALVLDSGWTATGDQVVTLGTVTVNDNTFVPKTPGTTTDTQTTTGTFAPTCTLPDAKIAITKTLGANSGDVAETLAAQASDTGGMFRIVDCKYIYNLDAVSSLSGVGTYKVFVNIDGQNIDSPGIFSLR